MKNVVKQDTNHVPKQRDFNALTDVVSHNIKQNTLADDNEYPINNAPYY